MAPRDDRHRRPGCLCLRDHLALQRFRVLATLRRALHENVEAKALALINDIVIDAGSAGLGEEARRLGCRVEAAAKVVVAPAEEPDMPTRWLHQSWSAIQSSVS
jgi:hypothetical protein